MMILLYLCDEISCWLALSYPGNILWEPRAADSIIANVRIRGDLCSLMGKWVLLSGKMLRLIKKSEQTEDMINKGFYIRWEITLHKFFSPKREVNCFSH